MTLHAIAVPYHMGSRNTGVGAGPLRLLASGISAELIDIGELASIELVNQEIARNIRQARASNAFPLVLSGNCNAALGVLAGLDGVCESIVWFDAHGDFHTPQTSISGSIGGMALALATAAHDLESRTVLFGPRDFDPGERERLCASAVTLVESFDLDAIPALRNAYVHLDLDVLDPVVSPGVNFQGAGGLGVAKLKDALDTVFERCSPAAMTIANYNPERDVDDRTLRIVKDVLIQLTARFHTR